MESDINYVLQTSRHEKFDMYTDYLCCSHDERHFLR